MKHVHLFPDSIFAESYIEFVNKNFDIKNHLFYIVTEESEKYVCLDKYTNVKTIGRNIKEGFSLLKNVERKASRLYIHSMTLGVLIVTVLLGMLVKKWNTTLIFWGGDLEAAIELKNKTKKNGKEHVKSTLNSLLVKTSNVICTLTKGEYEAVERNFNIKKEYKKAVYINPLKIKTENQIIKQEIECNKVINVQIGNSATKTNHYEETIYALERYKDEKMKIFCILSYGDEKYAEEITQLGKSVFGDKFIPCRTMKSADDYAKFTKDMDILFMNNRRQQGLGSIYAFLALGKKVFLRSDSPTWNYMVQDCGLQIFDAISIKNINFNSFVSMEAKDRLDNCRIASYYFYSSEYLCEVWRVIFD